MKVYKITEEKLKELLYDHYVLGCLEANGVDNWLGYMDNKIRYINAAFGIYNEDDDNWNEDVDFEDIVEIDLTEYEEIEEEEKVC